MKYIFTTFIFVFFFHTSLSFLKLQQINSSDKNLRQIAEIVPCGLINFCILCHLEKCSKCDENRVLPYCGCALGYYEQLGTCIKCPANCSVCFDSENCMECDQQYKQENFKCVCATVLVGELCSDPNNLTYNAYVGEDQESIHLEFSDLIRVKNVALEDQFVTSITNCDILDSNTKTSYGISSNAGQGVGCFIKENRQSVFVIMIGKVALDGQSKLVLPQINTPMIQKFQNGLSLSVLSALPYKSDVLVQLNYIIRTCYFPYPNLKGKFQEIIKFPMFFEKYGEMTEFSYGSPQNPQPVVDFDRQNGFTVNPQTLSIGDTISLHVSCKNMAQIITKDEMILTISDTADRISIVPQSDQGTITTMNLQVTKNFQISHGSNIFDDITVNVSSIPEVFTNYDVQLASNTLQVQIAPNTFKKEGLIYFQLSAQNPQNNLVSFDIMYFFYKSEFKLTVDQVETIKYPLTDLTFNAQIEDYDSATTDLSQFQVEWLCYDFELKLCKYQGGNPQILNQGLQMKITNFFIPLNLEFTFHALVQRKQDYFTLQSQSIKIVAPKASLTYQITNSQSNNPNLITFQEYFTIKMIYSQGPPKQGQTFIYKITVSTETSDTIQIVIDLDTITLNIEDYLPNLQFSLTNPTLLFFDISVVDTYQGCENVLNAQRFQIEIRKPPLGCILSIINTNQLIAFKDLVQMNVNSCTIDPANGPFTYQYFFYNISGQIQEEIINPLKINRQLLSFKQQEQPAFSSVLPPGDLTIMVVIEGKYSIRANFTQQITVKQNDFQSQEYESDLQQTNSYAIFNKQQQNYQQEVLYFQTISLAVQQFEKKNPTYIPSDYTNTMKNSIIQRLQDNSWSNLSEDVYLVSQKTVNIIQNSKIIVSVDVSVSQALKVLNEQAIDKLVDIIQKTDLSQLTTSERIYYKEILACIVKSYMFNVNNINSWTPEENKNMINYVSKALGGISQVMKKNDPQYVIETIDSELRAEKLDYKSLMSQYFDSADPPDISPEQKSLNYDVLIQNYPADSKLYKEELQNINQQYFKNATSPEMLNEMQKTYQIKIPQIFTEKKTETQIKVPITLQFGSLSTEEKLKCVQRSDFGKWVTSNCNTKVEIINNQRTIFCSCKKPDITSLTYDIEQLFNNKNIRDIFDGSGIQRLINLDGWYKYAPIWTMMGLNIFLVVIVIIGIGFDKRDKKLFIKKKILLKKLGQVNQHNNCFVSELSNNNNEGNLFMKIKNIDQSEITPKEQTPKNKQELLNDQNTENKKTPYFCNKIVSWDQILMKNPLQNIIHETQRISVEGENKKSNINEINNNEQQPNKQKTPQSQNLIQYSNKIFSCNQILANTPHQNNILETQRISNEGENKKSNINEINNNQQQPIKQNTLESQNLIENHNKIFSCDQILVNAPLQNNYLETQRISNEGENQKSNKNENINEINNNQQQPIKQKTPIEYHNNIFSCDQILLNAPLQNNFLETLRISNEQQNQKDCDVKTQNLNKTKQISLTDQGLQLEENKLVQENLASIQTQPANICLSEQQTQIQNLLNTQILRSSIDDRSEQKSDLKKIDKKQKQSEEEAKLFLKAKQKLQDYLSNEGHIKGILAFHIFFSTFIVYDEKFSRAIRFIIYYNKLVWLLALNSVFGVNLSVVQIIVLSITSTIVLLIVTTIITALLSKQKLKIIGFAITFIFLLFCYYSILVVISGQDPYDANIWIASYFLTVFINEYLIGLLICCAMYFTTKKILNKVESPVILQILGTGMLLKALKS